MPKQRRGASATNKSKPSQSQIALQHSPGKAALVTHLQNSRSHGYLHHPVGCLLFREKSLILHHFMSIIYLPQKKQINSINNSYHQLPFGLRGVLWYLLVLTKPLGKELVEDEEKVRDSDLVASTEMCYFNFSNYFRSCLSFLHNYSYLCLSSKNSSYNLMATFNCF